MGGNRSNAGTITLRAGFTPDPMEIPVRSGGALDVRALRLGPDCLGWVTRRPDVILRVIDALPGMVLTVVARDDTTLVVNGAAGGWLCSDDTPGSRNPALRLASPPPGRYDVWVGGLRAGRMGYAALRISTELTAENRRPTVTAQP